jgi:hypothetical protein
MRMKITLCKMAVPAATKESYRIPQGNQEAAKGDGGRGGAPVGN